MTGSGRKHRCTVAAGAGVLAMMFLLVGCSPASGPARSCPEALTTWMASSETFGMAPGGDSPDAGGDLLPSGLSASCVFVSADHSRSAVVLIAPSEEAGADYVDQIRAHLLATPGLTQATDSDGAFAFTTEEEGRWISVQLRPEQFLADLGDDTAGDAVVIVAESDM